MQTAFNNKLYPDYSQSGISPVTQDILSNTSAPETDEEEWISKDPISVLPNTSVYTILEKYADRREEISVCQRNQNLIEKIECVYILKNTEDRHAIQETEYLLNIPGMRESILKGLSTPIEECSDKLDW